MVSTSTFKLDGMTFHLHPQVPAHQVRTIVNAEHVGESDDHIRNLIKERSKSWPPAVQDSAVHYALHVHRANQELVAQFRL